jgi:hypothetical protein
MGDIMAMTSASSLLMPPTSGNWRTAAAAVLLTAPLAAVALREGLMRALACCTALRNAILPRMLHYTALPSLALCVYTERVDATPCRKQEAEFQGLDISFLNPAKGQGLPNTPTYGEQRGTAASPMLSRFTTRTATSPQSICIKLRDAILLRCL